MFAVCDLYEEECAVEECAICALTRKRLETTDLYTQNKTEPQTAVL
jgi:hypothetical protein